MEKPKTSKEPIVWRVAPYGGFAYGAKGLDNQIRLGADLLAKSWKNTEIGANAGVGFSHFFLATMGPVIQHRFAQPSLGPFLPEVFGGFSVYYASKSGMTDTFFGPRLGFNYVARMAQIGGWAFDAFVRFETEVFLFGADRVKVPVLGAAGVSGQF